MEGSTKKKKKREKEVAPSLFMASFGGHVHSSSWNHFIVFLGSLISLIDTHLGNQTLLLGASLRSSRDSEEIAVQIVSQLILWAVNGDFLTNHWLLCSSPLHSLCCLRISFPNLLTTFVILHMGGKGKGGISRFQGLQNAAIASLAFEVHLQSCWKVLILQYCLRLSFIRVMFQTNRKRLFPSRN